MIDKTLNKTQREGLYEKLREKKDFLLNDPDNLGSKEVLEAWFKWNRLSHDEQLKILNYWEKYYEDVKQTPSYMIFQEQREAAAKNDWGRVKELALDAKKIKENKDYVLAKPTSIDPWDFNHNMDIKAYEDIEEMIKELTHYSDVKKDKDLTDVFS